MMLHSLSPLPGLADKITEYHNESTVSGAPEWDMPFVWLPSSHDPKWKRRDDSLSEWSLFLSLATEWELSLALWFQMERFKADNLYQRQWGNHFPRYVCCSGTGRHTQDCTVLAYKWAALRLVIFKTEIDEADLIYTFHSGWPNIGEKFFFSEISSCQ